MNKSDEFRLEVRMFDVTEAAWGHVRQVWSHLITRVSTTGGDYGWSSHSTLLTMLAWLPWRVYFGWLSE